MTLESVPLRDLHASPFSSSFPMALAAEDKPVSACRPTVSGCSPVELHGVSSRAPSPSPRRPSLSKVLVESFAALQKQEGSAIPHLEEVVDEIFQLHAPPLISLHALAAPPRLCSKLLQLLQKHHPLQFAETSRTGSREDAKDAEETGGEEEENGEASGTQAKDGEEDVCVFVPWWKREGRRVALHFLKRCRKTERGGPVLLLLGTHPQKLHDEVLDCLRTCAPPVLPAACDTAVSPCNCAAPVFQSSCSPSQCQARGADASYASPLSSPLEAVSSPPALAASYFVHVAVPSVPPVTTVQQRLWGEVWPCYLNKTKPSGPKEGTGGDQHEGKVRAGPGEGEREVSASASIRQELLTPLELSEEEKKTHLFFLNAAMEISRHEGRSACIITYTPDTQLRKSQLPLSRKRQRGRTENETVTDTNKEAYCTLGHATVEKNGVENTVKDAVVTECTLNTSDQEWQEASASTTVTPSAGSNSDAKWVTNGCEANFGADACDLDRNTSKLERAVEEAFVTCMGSRLANSHEAVNDDCDSNAAGWHKCNLPKVVAACVDGTGPRMPLMHATVRAIGCVGEKLRRIFAEPDRDSARERELEATNQPENGSGVTGNASDLEDVSEGNYYCQGCVVYCSHEPCVLCAMALIHSRIKLLFFVHDNKVHGGITRGRLHLDRRLNHGYRVLCLRTNKGATSDQKGK
ncbi:cytidine and deoxycytidylate deaminase zinc-binding region domain-containing protein [Toxoplasma gondii ARI]|uniref:Cytidine and deoxycytidylate deaminase zinc-binding region domain-containing protein n=1 Tax=Toxoplasma gondii ARI TaxID=1074872 RepID=A0A139XVM7_TOXGO|nr:cytidine and deoxycytidylate deaminase zinc-binding region domain-containing protein [Toxoplasma gondii ARI]